MPVFKVTFSYNEKREVEVEADNEEKAKEEAFDQILVDGDSDDVKVPYEAYDIEVQQLKEED